MTIRILQFAAMFVVVALPLLIALGRLRAKPNADRLAIVFLTIGGVMFVALPVTIWLVFPEMR